MATDIIDAESGHTLMVHTTADGRILFRMLSADAAVSIKTVLTATEALQLSNMLISHAVQTGAPR